MVNKYVGPANFVKNLFKGGKPKTTGTEVISSVSTNVPKTTYQKKLRDLKIANQQLKASAAKLQQTTFESKQNMPFTFDPTKKNVQKKSKKKTKTKTKVFNVPKDFNKGGRVGLKRGTGLMSRKSNVQKIKETFGTKKNNPKMSKAKKKFPDLSGDGKTTFKDVLIGRGVIPKPKKRVI
tara:strand:+ start:33 stop:569 length:537 start_codon:yes stop_codon:yes gene_type:complete